MSAAPLTAAAAPAPTRAGRPRRARALVPLSYLAALAILAITLVPLLFSSQNKFTLPLGVATFQSTYSQDTAAIFAFTALSMLPALGFFLLAQRRIVGGLSGLAGSIKG